MTCLPLIYAPDPIFATISDPVKHFDDAHRQFVDDLLETLHAERAVGMAASMVGALQRIIVIDLCENNVSRPMVFVNPEIISVSETINEHEEASICFPGISAVIERPDAITLRYQDTQGKQQVMESSGYQARVIQHEMDYLDGKTFLDHLSRIKRERLLKKMQKYLKTHTPHVHGPHCNH